MSRVSTMSAHRAARGLIPLHTLGFVLSPGAMEDHFEMISLMEGA